MPDGLPEVCGCIPNTDNSPATSEPTGFDTGTSACPVAPDDPVDDTKDVTTAGTGFTTAAVAVVDVLVVAAKRGVGSGAGSTGFDDGGFTDAELAPTVVLVALPPTPEPIAP